MPRWTHGGMVIDARAEGLVIRAVGGRGALAAVLRTPAMVEAWSRARHWFDTRSTATLRAAWEAVETERANFPLAPLRDVRYGLSGAGEPRDELPKEDGR